MTLRPFSILVAAGAMAFGQASQPAKPAPAKPAAPKPAAAKPATPSRVDEVIQAVKAGVSEADVIDSLKQTNKPITLTLADRTKLKQGGVSDAIVKAMQDPAAAVAAAAPPPPPAAPAAPPPAPEPAAAPAPPPAAAPASSSGPIAQADKKRAIIDEFDYSTVMTSVQAVFGTQQNIGKGIRAMLTTRVAKDNKIVVVERAKIKALEAEQDRNASNRVKQGSGARVGRISGADLLLAGDIVIFGRDDKKKTVKGGGMIGGVLGAAANMNKEDKAIVAIDYRLIDAETSEIVATGEARGESVRKSKGFGGLAGALGKGVAGVEVDMTSSNFAETIIGEATMDCVNKLAAILNDQAANMKKAAREVETSVADVSGNSVTIAAGAVDGVNVGEVFEIHQVDREVRDPTTKELLDRITHVVGTMTVTSVRDKIATGTYTGSPAKVGMVARKKL
ncbi:MAG: CsgG/HfaB family protein [Acidobacteriia bacterium]|nr:CsgG/HfaB family protein [Terriglobia bacterium]